MTVRTRRAHAKAQLIEAREIIEKMRLTGTLAPPEKYILGEALSELNRVFHNWDYITDEIERSVDNDDFTRGEHDL